MSGNACLEGGWCGAGRKIIIFANMELNKKELGISAIKSLFSAIPFGIGTAFDEMLFEHRSRIKQERLNKFNELLVDYFEKNVPNFELKNLKTEEFSDVFESVLKKVMETNNINKLERFKNILVGQMSNSNIEMDFVETFLDVTSKLSENQIKILSTFRIKEPIKNQLKDQIEFLEKEIENARKNLQIARLNAQKGISEEGKSIAEIDKNLVGLEGKKIRIQNQLDELNKYLTADYYGLDSADFDFFTQDLVSKSLMSDTYYTTFGSTTPVKGISEFGIRYIEFIEQD